MKNSKKIENKSSKEKINVALKRETICLLDEIARRKVNQAIENGSLDIINLIRSKRGRGISYNSQINYLARIYLALLDEADLMKSNLINSPQLKKFLNHLNEINNFFLKHEETDDERY